MLGRGVIEMKEITKTHLIKGEFSMKKTMFVLALALVLVFSVASIAGAKYAGATFVALDYGYLSWGTGQAQQIRNGLTAAGSPGLFNGVHGGYTTATAKCFVCHSAHRAYSNRTTDGVGTNMSLTMQGNGGSCLVCHANGGGAAKQIEWATTSPGPHGSQPCSYCHKGGIHGQGVSKYWGMNAYMLGNWKDAEIDHAIASGNVSSNMNGWFVNGTTVATDANAAPSGVNAPTFAAGKAMATGYICNPCHGNSQFAVNVWGYAETRQNAGGANVLLTGHGTGAFTNHVGASCGPCHPGNGAGGYRYETSAAGAAIAWGCDQCHDMVGVKTNTTAFPHSNRNIAVYEWTGASATQSIVATQASGNLWMYGGSLATKDVGTGSIATNRAALVAAMAQPEFKVLNGVTSGAPTANWSDGMCLKCHVAIDSASLAATGSTVGRAGIFGTRHATGQTTTGGGKIYLWK
jgi:hypothetical protein